MSRTIVICLCSYLLLTGCFEKNKSNLHGIGFVPRTEFGYRGAVERSVQLKFHVDKSEISEITAVAQLPANYTGSVKYKWSLGDGLILESGNLEGQLNPEKSKVILQIKVKGFSAEVAKYIRFEIIGQNPKRRIFADGIISSQKENSFEEVVKEIENYKKESLNEK